MYRLILSVIFLFLLVKYLTRPLPPPLTTLEVAKKILQEESWISEAEMKNFMLLSNQPTELGSISSAIVAKTAEMYRRHVEKMMAYEPISNDDPDQANRVMKSLADDLMAAKHAGMKISRQLILFTPSSSNLKYWATVPATEKNALELIAAAQFLEE